MNDNVLYQSQIHSIKPLHHGSTRTVMQGLCGRYGIRTRETENRLPAWQAGVFSHSTNLVSAGQQRSPRWIPLIVTKASGFVKLAVFCR